MPLRVPQQYVPALEWLAALEPSDAEAVLRGFEGAKTSTRESVVNSIVESAKDAEEIAERLFDAIFSLLKIENESETTASRRDVPQELARSSDLELDDEQRETLAGRVQAITQTRAIRMIAKAVDLQVEHANLFRKVRIYSEIRPIFESDLNELPRSAVVTHNMRVEFMNSSFDFDSLYVTLERSELEQFRDTIQRELDKLATLDRLIESAGMSLTDSEGDEGQ